MNHQISRDAGSHFEMLSLNPDVKYILLGISMKRTVKEANQNSHIVKPLIWAKP